MVKRIKKKKKILYIDTTNSGISGDMFLAALLNLVPNPDKILTELTDLKNFLPNVSKIDLELIDVNKSGLKIKQLKLNIKESKDHRTSKVLKEALEKFLTEKEFSAPGKNYAMDVFNSLIHAEAAVHGKLDEKIHLHELSSVDTLIDIIGVTKALDALGIFNEDFEILSCVLPLGGGSIKAAHGTLPIPAPATVKILEKSNLIVKSGPIESELVTPTGAALLSNLKPKIVPYEMNLNKVAYSTGKKEFKNFLNVLRLFYGESTVFKENNKLKKYEENITILETDVDDVTGEVLGNFFKNIEKDAVLDIQVIPTITKKNRPGHIVRVLCHPESKFELIDKIIEELGTLGVRFNTIRRVCVDREIKSIKIEIKGKIYILNCKISFIESKQGKKIVNIKPEYEDLREICDKTGLSLKIINFFVQEKINQIYKDSESLN